MLCATALAQPGRVTVLTSDIDDITMLTTDHPRVTAEKVRLAPLHAYASRVSRR
ncbi:hypothetical protein [Streptomyces jumonjinensis]|uniref:hypothetical protein n=1 Tax=Streptomyces jumonjinensis TaxID=1945 RepID=UPI001295F327|nr:hypothetical protein [Streptomyces jumonjinensis]